MKKVVLLCVGSFNPITFMHVRLFVLAKDYLYTKLQWNVLGGIISPVHDDYKKKDLASSEHRSKMIDLALQEYGIPWLKLSRWEIEQRGWTKTLDTMEQHQIMVNGGRDLPTTKDINADDHVQVMLLCGADVIESFLVPGLWSEHQLDIICRKFGVVCVSREGSAVADVIRRSETLNKYADDIVIVPEWFPNQVSATSIRDAVRRGRTIDLLVPVRVAAYIKQERLYHGDSVSTSPLAFIFKALKTTDAADPYAQALEKLNWRTVVIPVLNFQFLGLPELFAVLSQPDNYSGLILSSPRAVEALSLAVKSQETEWRERLLAVWNAKPVYAVGEGTAVQARAIGLSSVCGETSGSEANLAQFIKTRKEMHGGTKLLFPCGDLRLETLRLSLAEENIPVEFVEVYETSAHPELASIVHEKLNAEGFPDANVVFSPSGVQFLDEIFRAESVAFKQTKYVAIGPTTAGALRQARYPVSAVAAHPNPESVAAAVAGVR